MFKTIQCKILRIDFSKKYRYLSLAISTALCLLYLAYNNYMYLDIIIQNSPRGGGCTSSSTLPNPAALPLSSSSI